MPRIVHAARPCCQSRPRCAACPAVLKRLEQHGLAERSGKRTYVVCDISAKAMTKARTQ